MPDVIKFKHKFIRQWPFPIAEAADIMLAQMDTQTKASIVMTSRKNLSIFRATIGEWIIDNFGMRQACGESDVDKEWIPVLEAIWDRLHKGDAD